MGNVRRGGLASICTRLGARRGRQASTWLCLVALAATVLACSPGASLLVAAETQAEQQHDVTARQEFAARLEPFYRVLAGQENRFALAIDAEVPIGDQVESVSIRIEKFDSESFDFHATHAEYAVALHRRTSVTALVLPLHQRVFLGEGAVDPIDHLAPHDMVNRLVTSGSQLFTYLPMLAQGDAAMLLSLTAGLVSVEWDGDRPGWRIADKASVTFDQSDEQKRLHVTLGRTKVSLTLQVPASSPDLPGWSEFEQVSIPRAELEQQLARGLGRALEVVLPSPSLTDPARRGKQVAHGKLSYVGDQRLVILSGTPQQIGTAHGQLLGLESRRCIDSVLNSFGTVQTIVTGRWFRHDLAAAYDRLRPHIPPDHILETRALAASLRAEPEVLEMLNVFPELFHCSGFAVFDSATHDGKLYHGRVLDYMTTIGLQDSATTFIVSVDGKIPFANVGYAGFTGSVSGMNARAISLGEMGGRGEGQWDGVPMATLMRRALEECSTLEEVTDLWTRSPRTCEYYYVFADGKTNQAVGVAATPESLQIVRPGQPHPLLGEGIADAVVLSAGSRLETLRTRVLEHHGKIDADKAMWLMSRPVAMSSNLHNVLFVPEDGIFYVANANHQQPAAERPYVKFDLRELLADPLPLAVNQPE